MMLGKFHPVRIYCRKYQVTNTTRLNFKMDHPPGFHATEILQVIDNLFQHLGLFVGDCQIFMFFCLIEIIFMKQQLGKTSNCSERRAQFMSGGGNEFTFHPRKLPLPADIVKYHDTLLTD